MKNFMGFISHRRLSMNFQSSRKRLFFCVILFSLTASLCGWCHIGALLGPYAERSGSCSSTALLVNKQVSCGVSGVGGGDGRGLMGKETLGPLRLGPSSKVPQFRHSVTSPKVRKAAAKKRGIVEKATYSAACLAAGE